MAKLEHEMEIIRLSQCIADVPSQKRLSILENLYHQSDNIYSVHELCEALNVARGTFYNHIFAVQTAASATKSKRSSCFWCSRPSMTAASAAFDSIPKSNLILPFRCLDLHTRRVCRRYQLSVGILSISSFIAVDLKTIPKPSTSCVA